MVEGGGKTVAIDVSRGADVREGDVATCLCQLGGLRWRRVVGSLKQVVGGDAGVREKPANDVGIVGAVVGHLRDGPCAEILVASETSISREMRSGDPDVVVAFGVAVGACEPSFA